MIINKNTGEIIATAFAKGHTHDFQLFKSSRTGIVAKIQCLANSGYQGLMNIHMESQIPIKKSK